MTSIIFSSQKSKLFASFAHAAAEYAYSRVEQNRCAVAPVSALGISTPRVQGSFLNILMVNLLVGILVIFSPKFSTYDTIKKAHDRAHAAQGLQP